MYHKLNLLLAAGIAGCLGLTFFLKRDLSQPNLELVPERQMARSPAYDSFTFNPNFRDGITLRQPVVNTIPQGWQAFPYENTSEDAARAAEELKNPLSFNQPLVRQQGAAIFGNYCQACHGLTGDGKGPVPSRGFPNVLSFLRPQALNMKDGEMFHILTYGKGNMPAHSIQLSENERWAAIVHVRILQGKYTEMPKMRLADAVQLYQKNCVACHGPDGSGYLVRAKKHNIPDFTSLAWQFSKTNVEIANRIEYGDEPDMPTFGYRLTRDQMLGLAIYVRSLAKPEGSPSVALPSTEGLEPIQIYRAYCMACHNVDGRGDIVRPGMPDIPDFTSANWHEEKKNPAELVKAILSGGKYMPPMKDKLTPEIAEKMVAFVRGFENGKQVVELEKQELPKQPVKTPDWAPPLEKVAEKAAKESKDKTTMPSPDAGQRLRAASVLFRQYCIVCHGPDGTGVPAMRAALPTLPDFTKASFQTQHSDTQLLVSILEGKGTLMPANRGRVDESQARELAALIRTFGPAGLISEAAPSSDFQQQFEQLQMQWDALEREIQALKKSQAPKGK
jgi:cbb3-type cytochrome c oxidase subunit III